MRAFAASIVAGLLVGLVPAAAHASTKPPVFTDLGLRVVKLAPAKKSKQGTCSQRSKGKSVLAKATKRLVPVSCEQAPKVQVLPLLAPSLLGP
jgi:hypothetical protein